LCLREHYVQLNLLSLDLWEAINSFRLVQYWYYQKSIIKKINGNIILTSIRSNNINEPKVDYNWRSSQHAWIFINFALWKEGSFISILCISKGPVKKKSWHTVVIIVIEVQLFLLKLTFMEMFIVWYLYVKQ